MQWLLGETCSLPPPPSGDLAAHMGAEVFRRGDAFIGARLPVLRPKLVVHPYDAVGGVGFLRSAGHDLRVRRAYAKSPQKGLPCICIARYCAYAHRERHPKETR